jgi:nicotinate-nucleotide pyrophosphorylase (carboxylating)
MFMDEIDIYFREDLGEDGDITSNILFSDEQVNAKIIAKENCIIAGIEETIDIFNRTGATADFNINDGDFILEGTVIAQIRGSAKSILKSERLVLNIIGRMSGIATETRDLVEKCQQKNPRLKISATRKTTPGFRKFEKRAVEIGGGEKHRFGLFDEIMIKDNHIKIAGSVEKALLKITENVKDVKIEIEVENEEDALTAAKYKIDYIMLDNFNPNNAERVTKKIKKINNNISVEISGGITKENIIEYASFADRISVGYLTHSAKNKDFSLEII